MVIVHVIDDNIPTNILQTSLGGAEIGLICMSVIVLLATSIAAVFLYRYITRYLVKVWVL